MNKENKDRFYYNKEFLGSPEGRSIRLLPVNWHIK